MNIPEIKTYDRTGNYARDVVVYPHDLGGREGLYNGIREYLDNNNIQTQYVGLRFDKGDGKPRHINLNVGDLDSYEAFDKKINYIITANNGEGGTGSDRWLNDIAKDYVLSTREFATDSFGFVGMGYCKRIFNTLFIKKCKGQNKCGLEVLSTINELMPSFQFNPKKNYQNYTTLLKVAKKNGISIINNAIIPNKKFYEKRNWDTAEEWYDNGSTHKLAFIDNDTWTHEYVFEGCNKDFTIVYDSVDNHFSLIQGDIRLRDDIRINKGLTMYEPSKELGWKKLYRPTDNYKRQNTKSKSERKTIFFDYETIADPIQFNAMRPYSISYMVLNDFELEEMDKDDKEGITKRWEDKAKCIIGWDCGKKFLEDIVKYQKDSILTLMSFNGANFDNFLLLDEILLGDNSIQV